MTNLIFLDIDGVLNNIFTERDCIRHLDPSQDEHCRWPLDPRMVHYVRSLCELTDAQIVVSSTWRKLFTLQEIGQMLEQKAGWSNPPLFDVTPDFKNTTRGEEVDYWLSQCPSTVNVNNYVILDDDSDFFPWQPLVQTHVVDGLTDREYQQALAILQQ